MDKVAILHAFYDVLGGGEYLSLVLYRVLEKHGFKPEIYTTTPIDDKLLQRMEQIYAMRLRNYRFIVLRGVREPFYLKSICKNGRCTRLRRLYTYKWFFENIDMDKYILTIDTQSNTPSPVDIAYIHYPAILDYMVEMGNKGLKRRLYNWLVRRTITKSIGKPRASLILTNSLWTARMIYRVYRRIASVVYPPVLGNTVHVEPGDKENIVVTVSRYTPEKNLDAIPYIASHIRNYKFIIVGTVDNGSIDVINKITMAIERYGVKGRVELYMDLPETKLVKILKRAKIYLHPPFPEHFGISIVKAMVHGCIPVVYRDGGAWYDIVSRISYFLGYRGVDEIKGIIEYIEDNYHRLMEKTIEVSRLFTVESFEKNIMKHVYHVLQVKNL